MTAALEAPLFGHSHEGGKIDQIVAAHSWPVAIGSCDIQRLITAMRRSYLGERDIETKVIRNMQTIGYAARGTDTPLAPFEFERRPLRANDVALEILYCGVCHSDLHQARNDWEWSVYPLVPGHEIVGRITEVGDAVTRHKIGDNVAIGCMVDSCQHCDQCHKGEEQLCREGNTQTYNSPDCIDGENTKGGYSKHYVVREGEVIHVICDRIIDHGDLLHWVGEMSFPHRTGRGDGAKHAGSPDRGDKGWSPGPRNSYWPPHADGMDPEAVVKFKSHDFH